VKELRAEFFHCLFFSSISTTSEQDFGLSRKKDNGKTRLLAPSRPRTADTEYKKRKQRKSFRKRAGIETTISHLKQDYRLVRCFLKGEIGDQINISLSSAVYKLKMAQVQAGIIFNLFYTSLKNMNCRKINYYPVSFLS
jgi:hypothetical protein